ncbi:MAG: ABC transporter permease [Thermodesulfobacteriota bacterium]
MNLHRILSLTMRHLYLYKRSLPRLMEIFYWPFLDLLVWGFVALYLARYKESLPAFISFLIGALILWDILFRSQQGIAISFFEDVWSRNLLNLFMSPLKPSEYLVTLMVVSIVKLLAASTVLVLLAWLIYSFNVFIIGLSLIPLVFNLIIMGWSIGIVTIALIMRFGQETEVLAWGLAFLFQPVSAVFYPVSVLPPFLQSIARFVPSSHVFEGMRAVIAGGLFPLHHLLWAAGLNCLYLTGAIFFFAWNFRVVKEKGLLAKTGE